MRIRPPIAGHGWRKLPAEVDVGYRNDRDITHEIAGYRRMLAFLTPDRGSATVWFTQTLDLARTDEWIATERNRTGKKINFLHVFLAAAGRMLHANPRLNRYCTGHRIWQRDGVTISVSAKKALVDGAKVVLLKLPLEAQDTAVDVLDRFDGLLSEGRSGKEIHQEKEVGLFLKLPAFVLRWAIGLVKWADRMHWLPGAFVDPDPMFTSLVVANLGSVGLDAAYHHLYEYGNCPFFAVIGRVREEPVVVDGQIVVRRLVDIKYTFDERVEDGLACALALAGLKELVEDPARFSTGVTDLHGRPPTKVSA